MHPATSSTGLRFFAHNPGQAKECPLIRSGETEEHIFLKSYIATTARGVGWESFIEYTGDKDIRPDVLCVSPEDGSRVAFEVQLSSTSLDRIRMKTARHEAAGIARTIWIGTGTQRGWRYAVPTLHIKCGNEPHQPLGCFGSLHLGEECERELPLGEVVTGILSGRLYEHRLMERFVRRHHSIRLIEEPIPYWVLRSREDDAPSEYRLSQYSAIVARRIQRKKPAHAKAQAQRLYGHPSESAAAYDCAAIIGRCEQVPAEVNLLSKNYAHLRYGMYNLVVVSHLTDRSIPELKQIFEQHPDWLCIDCKRSKHMPPYIRFSEAGPRVLRFSTAEIEDVLKGNAVLLSELE
jgi:hypothetical protein